MTKVAELLKEGVELHRQEIAKLRKIHAIVAAHPEWIKQVPELEELLKSVARE